MSAEAIGMKLECRDERVAVAVWEPGDCTRYVVQVVKSVPIGDGWGLYDTVSWMSASGVLRGAVVPSEATADEAFWAIQRGMDQNAHTTAILTLAYMAISGGFSVLHADYIASSLNSNALRQRIVGLWQ